MNQRRTADQIQRLLREVERDRAKGITVRDSCRRLGIGYNTYRRWRAQFDPFQVDDARRVRDLQGEVKLEVLPAPHGAPRSPATRSRAAARGERGSDADLGRMQENTFDHETSNDGG